MSQIPRLSFVSTVRTVQEKQQEKKVSVTFTTEAAYYWAQLDKREIVEPLKESLEKKIKVKVEWNPATLEVMKVEPAQ